MSTILVRVYYCWSHIAICSLYCEKCRSVACISNRYMYTSFFISQFVLQKTTLYLDIITLGNITESWFIVLCWSCYLALLSRLFDWLLVGKLKKPSRYQSNRQLSELMFWECLFYAIPKLCVNMNNIGELSCVLFEPYCLILGGLST
jgi:hypothetical protein